jgi:uncharacterized protein (DUF927 family)
MANDPGRTFPESVSTFRAPPRLARRGCSGMAEAIRGLRSRSQTARTQTEISAVVHSVRQANGHSMKGTQMKEQNQASSPDDSEFGAASQRFILSEQGIFYQGVDKDGRIQSPRKIGAPLEIIAQTRNAESENWGLYLKWFDGDKKEHKESIPYEWLQGRDAASTLTKFLCSRGFRLSPARDAPRHLVEFLRSVDSPARARCVEKLGWYGSVFVMPKRTFGKCDELIVFQNKGEFLPAFSVSGTSSQWRESVAKYAAGNSRLMFAIAAAFAGALLKWFDIGSGGFHFVGGSSYGKSFALEVAASVWGNPKPYISSWNITKSGLESCAAIHNDGILLLDELNQCNPETLKAALYMLGNGRGKGRATVLGGMLSPATWNLIFISTGEQSFSTILRNNGIQSNAGELVRMADIPADAGKGFKLFEDIHGLTNAQGNGARFADTLKCFARQFYGAVGVEYLEKLVANGSTAIVPQVSKTMDFFIKICVPNDADGQVMRVARRFALVAAAGELATCFGLTGWQSHESIDAVRCCFESWLSVFGGAKDREERQILERVHLFLLENAESRFQDSSESNGRPIQKRAGFCLKGAKENLYLVEPAVMRNEILRGLSVKLAEQVLIQKGWLLPAKDSATQSKYVKLLEKTFRCYVLTSDVLSGSGEDFSQTA